MVAVLRFAVFERFDHIPCFAVFRVKPGVFYIVVFGGVTGLV